MLARGLNEGVALNLRTSKMSPSSWWLISDCMLGGELIQRNHNKNAGQESRISNLVRWNAAVMVSDGNRRAAGVFCLKVEWERFGGGRNWCVFFGWKCWKVFEALNLGIFRRLDIIGVTILVMTCQTGSWVVRVQPIPTVSFKSIS